MYITCEDWLAIIRDEYLKTFIRLGGAAVKFVVPMEDDQQDQLSGELRKIAEGEDFLFVFVDAAQTKIHMVDKLFHEVARQIDWDDLAYSFLAKFFYENNYILPPNREAFNLPEIALLNDREEKFLRKELQVWLENTIYRDFEMSQEFRIAMIQLCIAQLDPKGMSSFLGKAIIKWLCGELERISELNLALIYQKVVRHNARYLLFSLSHWLKLVGKSGLVLCLDISRYTQRRNSNNSGFHYWVSAIMDLYELLRQFIDGTDELEGCLIAVISAREFLTDEKRGLDRYDALKLRICDEVRDKHRENPFAPLVRVTSKHPSTLESIMCNLI